MSKRPQLRPTFCGNVNYLDQILSALEMDIEHVHTLVTIVPAVASPAPKNDRVLMPGCPIETLSVVERALNQASSCATARSSSSFPESDLFAVVHETKAEAHYDDTQRKGWNLPLPPVELDTPALGLDRGERCDDYDDARGAEG